MADVGVIALDPMRLVRLEAYLDGLDQGCRRRAAAVADAAGVAGVPPPPALGELDLVASWCRRTADEIRWRRALLDDRPPLPPPPFAFTSRAAARRRADDLVQRIVEAMDERPRRPELLRRLLVEAGRGSSSPTFVASVVEGLGPGRVSRLASLTEELGLSGTSTTSPSGAEPADAPDGDDDPSSLTMDELRGVVADAVGEDHRIVDWIDALPPIVADVLARSDELHATGGNLIRAVRAWVRGPGPLPGPVPFTDLALDLVDTVLDPTDEKLWNTTSSFLATVAPAAGPAAPAVYVGAALCGLFGWLAATAKMSPGERDDHQRRYNPDTGETTYPSGSASNPRVDAAGVPLDHRYR